MCSINSTQPSTLRVTKKNRREEKEMKENPKKKKENRKGGERRRERERKREKLERIKQTKKRRKREAEREYLNRRKQKIKNETKRQNSGEVFLASVRTATAPLGAAVREPRHRSTTSDRLLTPGIVLSPLHLFWLALSSSCMHNLVACRRTGGEN